MFSISVTYLLTYVIEYRTMQYNTALLAQYWDTKFWLRRYKKKTALARTFWKWQYGSALFRRTCV